MRFLLIGSFADSLVRFRGALIQALAAKGADVHVAAPGLARGDIRKRLEEMGATVHDIPMRRTGLNPLADLGTLTQLIRLMVSLRPAAVLAYTVKPVIYGTLAAWLARVPRRYALITGLGYAFQGEEDGNARRKLVRKLVQALYALALRRTDAVFFQNPDDEQLFKTLRLVPADTRTHVVHGSGVDVAQYRQAPPPTEPRFLLIARLLGDKGVREYAAAAQRIRTRRPDVSFDLVGWIDENPDAISAHELDAWTRSGAVNYLGRLDDVRPAIAACSVYVLPSYREGTPRTVLEAMAMGRAVITTDAPGCRETVVDGRNGFLVPVKSADALAHAMERFLDDPDLAEHMGAQSRRIAEDKYDVHKVNETMLRHMAIGPNTATQAAYGE